MSPGSFSNPKMRSLGFSFQPAGQEEPGGFTSTEMQRWPKQESGVPNDTCKRRRTSSGQPVTSYVVAASQLDHRQNILVGGRLDLFLGSTRQHFPKTSTSRVVWQLPLFWLF